MSSVKDEGTHHTLLQVRGIGKQTVKLLARLDIHSLSALVLHLPTRYQDRTHLQDIRALAPGSEAVIEGVVTRVSAPRSGRTKLLCELSDDTGTIQLRFFHVLPFQQHMFQLGVRLRCYGDVQWGQRGHQMCHPECKQINDVGRADVETHLTAIYPVTEGLSQTGLRKLIQAACQYLEQDPAFAELLPMTLLTQYQLPTLQEALHFIHAPPQGTTLTALSNAETPAQQRLIFEELLAHRLGLLQIKQQVLAHQALPLTPADQLQQAFLRQLPFQLTDAQQRVLREIQTDLQQAHPMLRLLQGDVGAGKTVVAALAALQAVGNGHQVAMMAPTELLAEQHYTVMRRWLAPLDIHVVYLSGQVKGRRREAVCRDIANGAAQVIIGTQALFQAALQFHQLALVIVDEQHRFGVQQRALLRDKGVHADYAPHQLIMTATPIPRTLAMSFYADLDCSSIDALPPGRTPIVTSVLANMRRDEVIARISEVCRQGRQAYWVCPFIEASEVLNCQSAVATHALLQSSLPHLKIGLLHGRMRYDEKEATMRAFQQGETQVLVATTVIEVGVDVPNASLMIIDNAERMGLAQLHQLRGRVGRGSIASYCVLLYQQPLSVVARERLTAMRETTDGFNIAERDLALRGPGEFLGTRQAGEFNLRVADLTRDAHWLPAVQQAASVILREYPQYITPLLERWLPQDKACASVPPLEVINAG